MRELKIVYTKQFIFENESVEVNTFRNLFSHYLLL